MARPKGSSTRNKAFLLKRLQDMYGDDFHPIIKMSENAVELQKQAEANEVSRMDAINAWDKIAQYTEPKLKAMEVSAEVTTVGKDDAQREVERLLSRRTGSDKKLPDRG